MTNDQKFQLARDGVMFLVMILTFYWGRERKQAQDALDQKFSDRKEKVDLQLSSIQKSQDVLGRNLWAAIKILQVDVREEHEKWREETRDLRETLHSLSNLVSRLDERDTYGRRQYDKDGEHR